MRLPRCLEASSWAVIMSMKTVLGPLRSIALVGLFGVAGVLASRAAAQPAVLPPRIAPTPPKIAEIRITSTQLKAGTVVARQAIQTAMNGCLHEKGYDVTGWERVRKSAATRKELVSAN